MTRRLGRGVLCLFAALVLSTSGCGREAAKPAARKLTTVKVNLTLSPSYAPLTIASEAGYFADEGIDLETESVDQNAALLAALSGRIDAYLGPVRSGLFNPIVRGAVIQVVADAGHSVPGPCTPHALVAPPDMARRVAKSGFRGEKFALIRGGMSEYLLERFLEQQHLTKADVNFSELMPGQNIASGGRPLEALRLQIEPYLTQGLARGDLEVVATGEQIDPGHQNSVLIFGKRLLVDDPELGRRFMRAWLRGVKRFNEGKTERNVASVSRLTGLPPELVQRMCWPVISPDGQPNLESIDRVLAWSRQHGFMEKDLPRQKWWNPSFIEAAAAQPSGGS